MGKIKEIESIVVDTGIIYALADRSDSWHKRAVQFIKGFNGTLVVPCSVIPEACYLLNRFLGQQAETSFLKSMSQRELFIEHVEFEDWARCTELIEKYNKLNIGFVDASIIAVCERRKISAILTTDRKHFSLVRSKNNEAFQLLP